MVHVKYLDNLYFIVFLYLLTNTNRTFGNLCGISQRYLQVMACLFGIVNAVTRFIWGWLLDNFKFKILYFLVIFMELFISLTVYYSASYPILYIIENLLCSFCISGTFTMIIPMFNKIFGFKNGAKLFGLTGLNIGFASFLGPLLTNLMITDNSSITIYNKIYLVGAGFVLISLITLIFFEDKEYEYINKDDYYKKLN